MTINCNKESSLYQLRFESAPLWDASCKSVTDNLLENSSAVRIELFKGVNAQRYNNTILQIIEDICQNVFSKWKVIFTSPEIQRKFYLSKRKICIAAHTTPFLDGMILHAAMVHLGMENHQFYVRGLFGFGPSWCKEISYGGGFIKDEINLLKKEAEFCRILFPSGGTVIWKSGFYILAKELDADIIIIGIDYSKRCVVIDSFMNTNQMSFELVVHDAIIRLRKYSGGYFWFPLRILFGYGCETYPVPPVRLFTIRSIIIAIFVFLHHFLLKHPLC